MNCLILLRLDRGPSSCIAQIIPLQEANVADLQAEQSLSAALDRGNLFLGFAGFADILGFIYVPEECGDCTVSNGFVTPPEFWID